MGEFVDQHQELEDRSRRTIGRFVNGHEVTRGDLKAAVSFMSAMRPRFSGFLQAVNPGAVAQLNREFTSEGDENDFVRAEIETTVLQGN